MVKRIWAYLGVFILLSGCHHERRDLQIDSKPLPAKQAFSFESKAQPKKSVCSTSAFFPEIAIASLKCFGFICENGHCQAILGESDESLQLISVGSTVAKRCWKLCEIDNKLIFFERGESEKMVSCNEQK